MLKYFLKRFCSVNFNDSVSNNSISLKAKDIVSLIKSISSCPSKDVNYKDQLCQLRPDIIQKLTFGSEPKLNKWYEILQMNNVLKPGGNC